MKQLSEYTTVELKAMSFDTSRKLHLLQAMSDAIIKELVNRNAIEKDVEVVPDAEPIDQDQK